MVSLLIIIGIVVVLGLLSVSIFNRFVKNKNRVNDAWSNVDVALKRRHDLIPNLVRVVKAYAKHEKDTLADIVKARNAAVSATQKGDINDRIQSEKKLQEMLGRLSVVVEAYPDLKANQNFLDLQHQLSEIEETLARSRRYYNGTVRENNTYGESIPGVIFAGMFNFKHFDFYQIDESERQNVSISFDT